jgi:hypothetical protein
MSRTRLHANNAERQKAYRRRLGTAQPRQEPPAPTRPRRGPSRPARLLALQVEASTLCEEYAGWLGNLPDSLSETEQAELLNEAVQQLQAVVDLIDEIQLPRGFGRD